MVLLNNPFLTSKGIIDAIRTELLEPAASRHQTHSIPPVLKLKNRLMRSLFNLQTHDIPKLLETLNQDPRFFSYLQLKTIIKIILTSDPNTPLQTVLNQVECIEDRDWHCEPNIVESYNQHYQYLPEPISQETIALFESLAHACRSAMIFFSDDHQPLETTIYLCTYGLMILFMQKDGTFNYNAFNNLLESAQSKDRVHPWRLIHDLFLMMPVKEYEQDLDGWQSLIQKKPNLDVLLYWQYAHPIEYEIFKIEGKTRAPQNLGEAKQIWIQVCYPRFNEDPSFAKLCDKYHVDTETFNRSLNYMSCHPQWPKKHQDYLPNIIVKGEGEAEGFYWVKLPVTDKRALILGFITDCCQYVGGESSMCVADGSSLAQAGFYILLEKKSKKRQTTPIINDEINDTDYKIIGQSYAWKSSLGNLCLDSLECLPNAIRQDAQHKILLDFANAVLAADDSIRHVTLGTGGKTPENLFPYAFFPEQMCSGRPYGDAAQQYTIACRVGKYPHELANSRINIQMLVYLGSYLTHEASPFLCKLHELFLNGTHASMNHTRLCTNHLPILIHFYQNHHLEALTQETLDVILAHEKPSFSLAIALETLYRSNLLYSTYGDLIRNALSHKGCYPIGIMEAMILLQENELLDQAASKDWVTFILNHHNNLGFAKAIVRLYRCELLDEPPNILQVLSNTQSPHIVAEIIDLFNEVDNWRSHIDNQNFCLDMPVYTYFYGIVKCLESIGQWSTERAPHYLSMLQRCSNFEGLEDILSNMAMLRLLDGEDGHSNICRILTMDPSEYTHFLTIWFKINPPTRIMPLVWRQASFDLILRHPSDALVSILGNLLELDGLDKRDIDTISIALHNSTDLYPLSWIIWKLSESSSFTEHAALYIEALTRMDPTDLQELSHKIQNNHDTCEDLETKLAPYVHIVSSLNASI